MSSLSHKGQACMAWGGNVITRKRFLSPSMHLAPLSSVRSHNRGHPISLSTSTTMDMSALPSLANSRSRSFELCPP